MLYPKNGTVRHVIMHPFDGRAVAVTWEQFRTKDRAGEWTSETAYFPDEKEAKQFSLSL